jgi:hypothetical protein
MFPHDRMLEAAAWALWFCEVAGDPTTLLQPSAAELLVIRPLAGR